MDEPATPVVPHPSSTVLLMRERDRLEVLMVRHSAGSMFSSALVFPGGKMDASDQDEAWLELVDGAEGMDATERGLRVAGWREVFEETGLLPAAVTCPATDDRSLPYIELIRASGARLPLDEMPLLSRWITPRFAPKRFDTHFFLCPLDGDEVICDGFETVAAEWVSPREALEKDASGETSLLFPTKSQFRLIAECDSIDEAMAVARAAPVAPVEPRREVRPEGAFLTIPPDSGYAICEEPSRR